MFNSLKQLKKFSHEYIERKGQLGILVLLISLQKLLILILPYWGMKVIDTAVYTKNYTDLIHYSIIYILLEILFIIVLSIRYFKEELLTAEVQNDLREHFIEKIYKIPYMNVSQIQSGYFIERINIDIPGVVSLVITDLPTFITNAILTIALFVVMFKISVYLTLLILPMLPLFIFGTKKLLPYIKHYKNELLKIEESINNQVEDTVNGHLHVKIYNLHSFLKKRLMATLDKYYKLLRKYAMYDVLLDVVLVTGALNFASALLKVGGSLLILKGSLTIGVLTAYLTYFFRFWDSIEFAMNFPKTFQVKFVSLKRLLEVFDAREEETKTFLQTINEIYEIRLENVELRLGKRILFKGLNLLVRKGEHIGITGINGTGKSTLAKLIAKIILPTRGTVYINGIDYRELPATILREKITLIPQIPYLFRGTVKENILFDRINSKDINLQISDIYQLDRILKQEGIVDNKGTKLSGGERKILEILRGINRDSDVYILDEPFAFVDEKYKFFIEDLIKKMLMEKKIVILITHNPVVLKYCDAVYELKGLSLVKSNTYN